MKHPALILPFLLLLSSGCIGKADRSTGELRSDLMNMHREIQIRQSTQRVEARQAALLAHGTNMTEEVRMDSMRAIQDSVFTPSIQARLAALAERAKTEDPALYREGQEMWTRANREAARNASN